MWKFWPTFLQNYPQWKFTIFIVHYKSTAGVGISLMLLCITNGMEMCLNIDINFNILSFQPGVRWVQNSRCVVSVCRVRGGRTVCHRMLADSVHMVTPQRGKGPCQRANVVLVCICLVFICNICTCQLCPYGYTTEGEGATSEGQCSIGMYTCSPLVFFFNM